MTLVAGSKLGPYEILAPLGAGGMGEVYRAKDARLGRDVAIKVLPASFSADADRLRRFEQEARAAGILNHPNITAVYDIGTHEGAPYVVQELLEGETLRSQLAGGRLSPRKAIETSLQIAHGLAAAHEKGIVHRDLKPENLFVTRDGRVKILDFGLAKLTLKETGPEITSLPTATAGTEPGVVLGTLGYMSPEQVRGRPADARSDIFSFGAILYEMLSGNRAFRGDSAADTMSAILKEDPPDLSVTNQNISPGLERIVRHCLEKNPEQRFHSAHDVAFALEALSATSGPSGIGPAPRVRPQKRLAAAAGIAVGLGLVLLAFLAGRRTGPASSGAGSDKNTVIHQRLTFRRGNVLFARFAPDGQSVVYGAAWGDRPAEIFLSRIGSPESRPLGIPSASLLSVSSTGELAILLKKANVFGTFGAGTLARVALGGGAPKELLEGVEAAEWGPDGTSLAVVREREGKAVLEFPIGKQIALLTGDGAPFVRIAPDGKSFATIGEQSVVLIGLDGKRRVLSQGWVYVDSLAWNAATNEVWFEGVDARSGAGLRAVNLSGQTRTIAATTDVEVLHDIREGKVLIEREINTREILLSSGGAPERDFSWLDGSNLNALSHDGRLLLLTESGEGGGEHSAIYLRSTDGSPAVRVGDGRALDLSPDGKRVLALVPSAGGDRLMILPVGPGEPQTLDVGTLAVAGGAFVPPDGRRIVIGAREQGHRGRGYLLEPGTAPRAFTPEGLSGNAAAFSPDGKFFAVGGPDEKPVLYPISGGEPRPLPGLESGDNAVQWSADGESLYVTRFGEVPLRVFRYRLSTGRKDLWKAIIPTERTGFIRIEAVAVTPDAKSYAYSDNRVTASDLYVVTGWK